MNRLRRRPWAGAGLAAALTVAAVLPAGAIPPVDTTSTTGVHVMTIPLAGAPGYGGGAVVDIADNGWVGLATGLWKGIGYPEFAVGPIPIPTNPQFTVTAVGKNGLLAGNYVFTGSGARRGFVRYPDGTIEDLPIPAGYQGFNSITPKAISDEGYIVGTYQSFGNTCGPTTSGECSFLMTPGGGGYTVETLPPTATNGRFSATTVGGLTSTTGIIVGGANRTWTSSGGYVDLQGGLGAVAWDINASGEIAGYFIPVNGITAAGFWPTRSSVVTAIPHLGADTFNFAWALNDAAEVVGWSGTSSAANTRRAYVWDATNGTRALGQMPGDSFSDAKGITEDGKVVGSSASRQVIWDLDGDYDIDYPPDIVVGNSNPTVLEGATASYAFVLDDADGDPFDVSFTDLPPDVVWEPADAPDPSVLSWATVSGDAGTYSFQMTLEQQGEPANSLTVPLTFTVVEPLQMTPIGDRVTEVGAQLQIQPQVVGAVRAFYSAFGGTPSAPVALPAGASISSSTGLFSWTPTDLQVGQHVITIRVDDFGSGLAQRVESTFTVTVQSPGDVVEIFLTETVGVGDAVDVRLPVTIVIDESIGVVDEVPVRPAVRIALTEDVSVGDDVDARPPLLISIDETIAVGDQVAALLPVSIVIDESIGVSDAVAVQPAVTISIDEAVTVADEVSAVPEPLASVIGRAWSDLDGDGVRDSGEPALPGVVVYADLDTDGVRDSGEPIAITSMTGNYTLGGLVAGSYSVRVVIPAGYRRTHPSPSHAVVLAPGQVASGRDVGLDPFAIDTDGDDIADQVDGTTGTSGFSSLRTVASNGFTDRHRAGGSTFGVVVDRSSLDVEVRDAVASADGVRVSVADEAVEQYADFRFCGAPELVQIRDGTIATLTCGSLRIDVTAGEVQVETSDGAIVTVTAGESVLIDEVGGVVVVTALAGTPTVTADGSTVTMQPGQTIAGPGGPLPGSELDRAARFVPLSPVRLFDTRPNEPGAGPKGKLAPDSSIDVQVGGRVGVPPDAVAVVMNVTVTDPDGPGFVTVYPTGVDRPLASSVNIVQAGQVRPNLVTVRLGDKGKVTLYTLGGAHLLADVAGYYVDADAATDAGRFVPLTPQRLLDTRPGEPGPGPKGKLVAGETIVVDVLGVGDVPDVGVAAIVVNVAGTEAGAAGFVTAFPTGETRPVASNVNLERPGATAPNLAIVPIGEGGTISLYTLSAAHLLADVTGYITDDTAAASIDGLFVPLDPVRVFDTRESESPPGPKGYVPPGGSIVVDVAGTPGIPTDAAGVVLNVTGTESPIGFLTAWETGPKRPVASTLNFAPPLDTRANAAMLPVGAGGRISFFTLNGSDIFADAAGYFLG